jgi:hypothetical protein
MRTDKLSKKHSKDTFDQYSFTFNLLFSEDKKLIETDRYDKLETSWKNSSYCKILRYHSGADKHPSFHGYDAVLIGI